MCRPGSKVLSPVRQKRNCAASIAASVLPGLGRGAADQNAQPEVCTGAGGVEAPRPDGPVEAARFTMGARARRRRSAASRASTLAGSLATSPPRWTARGADPSWAAPGTAVALLTLALISDIAPIFVNYHDCIGQPGDQHSENYQHERLAES